MPFLRMTPAPGDEHSGLPSSSYQFATHRSTSAGTVEREGENRALFNLNRRHETEPGRLDQSRSCRFLKVATHPGWQLARQEM